MATNKVDSDSEEDRFDASKLMKTTRTEQTSGGTDRGEYDPNKETMGLTPTQKTRARTKSDDLTEIDSYYLLINDPSFLKNSDYVYPNNVIVSSKYTLVTFVPLNLFEQFRRIANIYFLMIIGIQTIPGITPFSVWTSVTPLVFILLVGAIKDGLEDYVKNIIIIIIIIFFFFF
ncbi:P-type ATPase [Reticulomyxa filosa]|uniref:P-type ATPase n=1 Tax=Reticulomyxa filosa TaxID=46433 RepID=X6MPM6_RETFI|nr:P-type ATPase [Reticulomyxa filosa]|eukprot:ETO15809.1 P-type ATPase [Reticulomyxa filosa]